MTHACLARPSRGRWQIVQPQRATGFQRDAVGEGAVIVVRAPRHGARVLTRRIHPIYATAAVSARLSRNSIPRHDSRPFPTRPAPPTHVELGDERVEVGGPQVGGRGAPQHDQVVALLLLLSEQFVLLLLRQVPERHAEQVVEVGGGGGGGGVIAGGRLLAVLLFSRVLTVLHTRTVYLYRRTYAHGLPL